MEMIGKLCNKSSKAAPVWTLNIRTLQIDTVGLLSDAHHDTSAVSIRIFLINSLEHNLRIVLITTLIDNPLTIRIAKPRHFRAYVSLMESLIESHLAGPGLILPHLQIPIGGVLLHNLIEVVLPIFGTVPRCNGDGRVEFFLRCGICDDRGEFSARAPL
jgi:hypothetical protein